MRLGGIYADMDTYCYKNFHDQLKGDTIYIGPSQVEEHELVQNSLLASHGRSLFWREVVAEAFKRIKEFDRGIGTIATGISSPSL
jgi:mannosyltransferase OCH1-like enzyme